MVVEVEQPYQDALLNLLLTTGRMMLRNLKHPVTMFQTIAVVDGHVVLVQGAVLAVAVIPMR
jgi:hypothetical protein